MGTDSATFHAAIVRRSYSIIQEWGRVTVRFGDEWSKFCEKQLPQTNSPSYLGRQNRAKQPRVQIVLCFAASVSWRIVDQELFDPPTRPSMSKRKGSSNRRVSRLDGRGVLARIRLGMRGCISEGGGGGASTINP